MKTRSLAMCLAFSFIGTSLFAQNKQDTVPQKPKTDTTSPTKTDTTKVSAFMLNNNNFRQFPMVKDTIPSDTTQPKKDTTTNVNASATKVNSSFVAATEPNEAMNDKTVAWVSREKNRK